jgi:hypothetical protein
VHLPLTSLLDFTVFTSLDSLSSLSSYGSNGSLIHSLSSYGSNGSLIHSSVRLLDSLLRTALSSFERFERLFFCITRRSIDFFDSSTFHSTARSVARTAPLTAPTVACRPDNLVAVVVVVLTVVSVVQRYGSSHCTSKYA